MSDMRLTAEAPPQVGSAPMYETQAAHRCNTWRFHGNAGMECAYGHVILPGDVPTAKLRAERIPDHTRPTSRRKTVIAPETTDNNDQQ